MCVILIGKITKQQHLTAKSQNPDGFSLFTEELGLIKAPSDAVVEKAIGKFGIWHYRIGTSGTKGVNNIHPFPVCHSRYFLYHNGILGAGKGELSDTAALAKTLQSVGVTTARSVLQSLSNGNRFVLVKADDPTKFELFGDWAADEGVIMSHKLYTYVTLNHYGGKYTGIRDGKTFSLDDDDDDDVMNVVNSGAYRKGPFGGDAILKAKGKYGR